MAISRKFKAVATTLALGAGLAACEEPVTTVNSAGVPVQTVSDTYATAQINGQTASINKPACKVDFDRVDGYAVESYDFKHGLLILKDGVGDNATAASMPINSLPTKAGRQDALDAFKGLAGTSCEGPKFSAPQ